MTRRQKLLWRKAINSAPIGLLCLMDAGQLVVWVIACDTHREACEKSRGLGLIVKSPNKGIPMQNPYLPIINKQAQIMIKAAGELGFTPIGRSRLKMLIEETPFSPLSPYGYKWQQARLEFLRAHPLCQCPSCDDGKKREMIAEVVDHKIPHRGNAELFWDKSNWQSMSKSCHDRKTASEDAPEGKKAQAKAGAVTAQAGTDWESLLPTGPVQ